MRLITDAFLNSINWNFMRKNSLQMFCTCAFGVLFIAICFATKNYLQICAYLSSWVLLVGMVVSMQDAVLLFSLPFISLATYLYWRLLIEQLVKAKWIAYSMLAIHSAGGFLLGYFFSGHAVTASSILILVFFLIFAISLRTYLLQSRMK